MIILESNSLNYWEKTFASRSWGLYPPEELVRFISRNFKSTISKSNVKILEIGCGPGPNIWYLAREGFSVAGIDGSATAILQAKERLSLDSLPSELPTVDLRVGNFCHLPWADEYFDVVLDIEALYANNMQDIQQSISEVFRALKHDGQFFGKMFGISTTGSQSGKKIEPGTYLMPTEGPCAGNCIAHFFTKEECIDLFSSFSNLRIDYVERSDMNGGVQIFEWLITAKK